MKWTANQQEAIEKRNNNILVSAGAGSGKTAVLSERVLEFVKANNSINDLLILTFTKAAALEMKQRIYKKLKNEGLDEEAKLALNANITTFDAYSLGLVKKYYYYLGIDKNIGIADSNIITEEKKNIIVDILNELYEKEDKIFYNFLIKENIKDDTSIIDGILKLSNKLDLLVDPVSYLNSYLDKYYDKDFLNKIVDDYNKLVLSFFLEKIDKLVDLKNLLDEDNIAVIEYIDSFVYDANHLNGYDELYDLISNFKMPRLKPKSDDSVKEAKTLVTAEIKKLYNDFLVSYPTRDSILADLEKSYDDASFICSVCLNLIKRITDFKNKYSYYTYNDIAKLAIKLVDSNHNVREELTKQFKEILVDEYQDTCDLQETFLSYITNNNLYMVGDIKQSIYRFRNANPYIFKNKYSRFKNNNGGIKIDLLENFRSRKEVLNSINEIFTNLMTDDFGDSSYEKDGKMRYGLKSYDDFSKGDYRTEALVYEYDKESEYAKDFKKDEIEVFICAKKVKELVDNTYSLVGNNLVKTSYSDIAIIVDKSTNFVLFKKVFEYFGIPLAIERDLDVKDISLTKTLIALLDVIVGIKENKYDIPFKHALVSVLRSFIFNMSDKEIYDIIKNANFDIDLVNIIKSIDLNNDAFSIYYEALSKVDIYKKLSLIGNINTSLTIIDYIAKLLLDYNKLGYDLKKSIVFLSDILDSDYKMNFKSATNKACEVKLMTIHHSKGLEYSYVICPFLNSKLNDDDFKLPFNFNLDYGLYAKKSDQSGDKSVKAIMYKASESKKLLSERVRLLYVALTRAREKLILVLEKDNKKISKTQVVTFKDMLNYSNALKKYEKKVDILELGLTKDYNSLKNTTIIKTDTKTVDYEDIDYRSNILVKGKISKENYQIIDDKTRYILELGTNIHNALANLDLKNPDYSKIDVKYQEPIKKMLNLAIFKDINKANIYQEYEFYFNDKESYYGIMDLLLEYDDHFVIIDYKLADLNKEEYLRQLGVYKKYLKTLTEKKIYVYLVSIMRLEVKDLTNEI